MIKNILIGILLFVLGFIVGVYCFPDREALAFVHSNLLSNLALVSLMSVIIGSVLTLLFGHYFEGRKKRHEQAFAMSYIISSLAHSFKYINELYGFLIADLKARNATKFNTLELFSDIDKTDLVKFDGLLFKNAFLDFKLMLRQLEHLRKLICNVYNEGYVTFAGSNNARRFELEADECYDDSLKAFVSFFSNYSEKIKQYYSDRNISQHYKNPKLGNLYFLTNKTFFNLQKALMGIVKSIQNSKIHMDDNTKTVFEELKKYEGFIEKPFL